MFAPTPQGFIESWPLYTRADILNFDPPKAITRMCRGTDCRKETTWMIVHHQNFGPDVDSREVRYDCGLCHANKLVVIYRRLDWRRKPDLPPPQPGHYSINDMEYAGVQKIGQIPPPSIDIPAELDKRLGATATYYREGLLCRSQNLGIGAVAYMRRVIEDKTDELIDVVGELAKTYGAEEKVIEALLAAKKQVQYEEKLHVASEVIPEALRPGGVNPLGQLYKHLSVGVHGKSDDECVVIFDELQNDFEYVFRHLYIQAKERQEFAKRVQRRAGKPV